MSFQTGAQPINKETTLRALGRGGGHNCSGPRRTFDNRVKAYCPDRGIWSPNAAVPAISLDPIVECLTVLRMHRLTALRMHRLVAWPHRIACCCGGNGRASGDMTIRCTFSHIQMSPTPHPLSVACRQSRETHSHEPTDFPRLWLALCATPRGLAFVRIEASVWFVRAVGIGIPRGKRHAETPSPGAILHPLFSIITIICFSVTVPF